MLNSLLIAYSYHRNARPTACFLSFIPKLAYIKSAVSSQHIEPAYAGRIAKSICNGSAQWKSVPRVSLVAIEVKCKIPYTIILEI